MPEPLNYWQAWAVIAPLALVVAWRWTIRNWRRRGWPLPWEKGEGG